MTNSTGPIVGIDLGTTNSVVAAIVDGKPTVLEDDGEKLLPSPPLSFGASVISLVWDGVCVAVQCRAPS